MLSLTVVKIFYPNESPFRLLGLHLLAELVVAPEPDGAGVGSGVDAVGRGRVEAVVGGVLQPEPAAVGSNSEQELDNDQPHEAFCAGY